MTARRTALLLVISVLSLAGCSLLPQQPPPASVHDFGPPAGGTSGQQQAATPNGPAVRASAPDWLGSDAILYRFLFDNATQLRRYARNRWAAPPAELLAERVRVDLQQGKGGTPGILNLRLQRFEQDFTSHKQAHVYVRVVASLHGHDGHLEKRRVFQDTRACDSADVAGGIRALSAAADAVAGDIAAWATSSSAG
ncbi:MAG TPA: ABC-type transport auxiliary lipoprotein family protein [Gammaproteobacteria bacterium]|nr:ABC-type transport auxiliary lipoprotein family protein [Gammaproteobacteria bacterium]